MKNKQHSKKSPKDHKCEVVFFYYYFYLFSLITINLDIMSRTTEMPEEVLQCKSIVHLYRISFRGVCQLPLPPSPCFWSMSQCHKCILGPVLCCVVISMKAQQSCWRRREPSSLASWWDSTLSMPTCVWKARTWTPKYGKFSRVCFLLLEVISSLSFYSVVMF